MTKEGLFVPDADRRVIPRWRDSRVTAASGELDVIGRTHSSAIAPGELPRALALWRRERSIETAAEALSVAVVVGEPGAAHEPARYLVDAAMTAPAVKALAQSVLSPQRTRATDPLGDAFASSPTQPQVEACIRALKKVVHESPRNVLAWVDLARAYAVKGQHDRSEHAMETALKLSRTNRFVLRSAARLFVHLKQAERAHDLLRQSRRTTSDPWLLAAEIATASVAGRSSPFTKDARALLGHSAHPPRHTAELASAVATLELHAGQARQARRFFRQSLTDPTENAVAQAEWAAKRDSALEVPPEMIRQAQSHEAQALADYRAERWGGVLSECRGWIADEPFSTRPSAWGSYLAGVVNNDAQTAEEFARQGLLANPRHPLLLNNLVVALVEQGALKSAQVEFKKIPKSEGRGEVDAAILATEGLISFRVGDLTGGRRLYQAAAMMASGAGWRAIHALALLYLAREEQRIASSMANAALGWAEKACQGIEAPEIRAMLRRLAANVPNLGR